MAADLFRPAPDFPLALEGGAELAMLRVQSSAMIGFPLIVIGFSFVCLAASLCTIHFRWKTFPWNCDRMYYSG